MTRATTKSSRISASYTGVVTRVTRTAITTALIKVTTKQCTQKEKEEVLNYKKSHNRPGWGFTKLLMQIRKIFRNFGP